MNKVIYTAMVLTTSVPLVLNSPPSATVSRRIFHGVPDKHNKYNFVVSLISIDHRACTGILLTPEWVMTTAHCTVTDIHAHDLTHIQYDDLLKAPNFRAMNSSIVAQVIHPGYRHIYGIDDIALLRIEPVSMEAYGKISMVDYLAVVGRAVEYVGTGITEENNYDKDVHELTIGKGVAVSCFDLHDAIYVPGLYLCVASKCTNNEQKPAYGDEGGPLFYDGKVVGILSYIASPNPCYTAISPYTTWIRDVLTAEEN